MTLTISSPAFSSDELIPAHFTCDGENISPELVFANIPKGTQSLALTMEDPDTQRLGLGGVWDHWVVWDMPPTILGLGEGADPSGILGSNTAGKVGYMGPCPPEGREHHYVFTLYALDSMVGLYAGATKKELLNKISGHVIEQVQLVGRYLSE